MQGQEILFIQYNKYTTPPGITRKGKSKKEKILFTATRTSFVKVLINSN